MDTITSTADSKDCPGICVHTLATLICYEVLDNVPCPSASMKCCIEQAPLRNSTQTPNVISTSASSSSQGANTAAVQSTSGNAKHPTATPNPSTAATVHKQSSASATMSLSTLTTHRPKTTQRKPAPITTHKTTTRRPTTSAASNSNITKKQEKHKDDNNEDKQSKL